MPETFGSQYMLAAGNGTQFEPMRRHTWEVQIDTFDTVLSAQQVTFDGFTLDKSEIWHFNTRVQYIHSPKPGDLTITLIDFINPNIVTELWTWFKQHADINSGIEGYASDYKRHGQIFQYDVKGNLVRTWSASGLAMLAAPTPSEALDYSNQEAGHITLKLACDVLTLDGLVTQASQSVGNPGTLGGGL
jgi:hypothetical protein